MQMNRYPIWWNSTITIYNRFEDKTTNAITWKRTVLNNCFWKKHFNLDYGQGQSAYTGSPIVICRIPSNDKFVEPFVWKTLNETQRRSKFTLQNGDIIIGAKVTDEIDEYTKGHRSSDLLEKYKDKSVTKISLVVDNSDESRNIPHYFVR